MPNGSNVQWCKHYPDGAEILPNGVGGDISQFIPAVALNVGDLVYFSGVDGVTKSTAPANYAGFAGVVVGGDLTQDYIVEESTMSSASVTQVCTAGKRVLVQMSGIAWVMANAAIAAGVPVTVDATIAGRASTVGATSGQITGTAINAAAGAGSRFKMFVCPR